MKIFEESKTQDFLEPTAVPASESQRQAWQAANRAWWESHPMRYDWGQALAGGPGEQAWFEEIDQRFFSASVVPSRHRPFDGLIPFEALQDANVLEIGVGMGSHAQLLAGAARRFVGIDLTTQATVATRRRFSLFGLPGEILQMNGELLAFPNHTFDVVWSWGVIHHSANTRTVLAEMRRVLKPSGRALVMVYHRALVPWYVYGGLFRGVFLGGLLRHRDLHAVVQSYTDGALARYYTAGEWQEQVAGLFQIERMETYGNRAESLPIPSSALKRKLLALLPESFLRFWLTSCRQGTMLFSTLRPI